MNTKPVMLALMFCAWFSFTDAASSEAAKKTAASQDTTLLDKALWEAIEEQHPGRVGIALRQGANPEAYKRDPSGWFANRPLLRAARQHDAEIVEALLKHGADANKFEVCEESLDPATPATCYNARYFARNFPNILAIIARYQ